MTDRAQVGEEVNRIDPVAAIITAILVGFVGAFAGLITSMSIASAAVMSGGAAFLVSMACQIPWRVSNP